MSYPRLYGPYTLLERLGHGGMSEVDLACQSVADANYVRLLVIKRLRPDIASQPKFVRMLQDEARINTELQHANIAQIYNFGHIGDEYYLAMEYIAGTDLRALQRTAAKRDEPLSLRLSLRVLADVLDALDYAHRRVDTFGRPMNVVHRDVNPRNIMLSARGEVKLIDFGVAKSDNRPEETITHALKGKFAYMSPEQIDGSRPLDGRSDLYAIGLILHELVAGHSPLAGLNDIQTMHRILAGKIPPLPLHAEHPVQILHSRAVATDPDDRYPDAAAMRRAIIDAAAPLGGLATSADVAEAVLRLMPETDRSRLDRLGQYRDAEHPLDPGVTDEQPLPTITDINLDLPELPTSTTVHTPPSVLEEARTASRPILIGVSAGIAVLLAVAVAIWAADRFIVPTTTHTQPLVIPPPPLPEPVPALETTPEPTPEPEPEPELELELTPEPKPRVEITRPPTPELVAAPEPEEEVVDTVEAGETGFVSVTSVPLRGLSVLIDGADVGPTPLRNHELSTGTHTIAGVHPETGERRQQTVTILAGRSALVTLRWE